MRVEPIVALSLALAACASPPPRDLSNASLSSAQTLPTANDHATTEIEPTPPVLSLLASPDRTPADRALDAKRQGADILTFLAPPEGGRVAEIGCGGGYWTELLARSVGPRGAVLGENAPDMLAKHGLESVWASRLARPADANVTRVDRPLVDPLPQGVRGLDLVFLSIGYGELARLGVDRDAMNHAIHLALRHGGRYVVIDETPPEGALITDLHALHADESRNVRREAESVGFDYQAEGRFLRDSSDPRDWDATPPPPTQKRDRFVLAFVKP